MKHQALILAVVIAFFVALVYFGGKKPAAELPPFPVDPDGAVPAVVMFIQGRLLNDPVSYQSVSWFPIEKNKAGNYEVRHRFKARSAEGEYNDPATLLFILNPEGVVIGCR